MSVSIKPNMRAGLAAITGLLAGIASIGTTVGSSETSRGAYLASIMDCSGCHTPGALTGQPDAGRPLAGSNVGFNIPDLGIVYPPNLTPDPETGLGAWTEEQIAAAIRTGVRPDGRILAPIMPYKNYARLNDADAQALAAYLKGMPAVRNKAPDMTGPGERPTAPYLDLVVPR